MSLPYDENLIPKNSFCSTVYACMVMQLKLVVVAVDNAHARKRKNLKNGSLKTWHFTESEYLLSPVLVERNF